MSAWYVGEFKHWQSTPIQLQPHITFWLFYKMLVLEQPLNLQKKTQSHPAYCLSAYCLPISFWWQHLLHTLDLTLNHATESFQIPPAFPRMTSFCSRILHYIQSSQHTGIFWSVTASHSFLFLMTWTVQRTGQVFYKISLCLGSPDVFPMTRLSIPRGEVPFPLSHIRDPGCQSILDNASPDDLTNRASTGLLDYKGNIFWARQIAQWVRILAASEGPKFIFYQPLQMSQN